MTFAVVALFLGGDGGRDDIPGRLSLLLVITRDVSGDAAFMFSKLRIIDKFVRNVAGRYESVLTASTFRAGAI
jgi:hypothetical protein